MQTGRQGINCSLSERLYFLEKCVIIYSTSSLGDWRKYKMNIVKIELSFENNEPYETQMEFDRSSLTISDSLIKPLLEKAGNNKIISCYITIGANNMAVSIQDYTFTDTIFIESFYNISSYISILQVKDTNVHIIEQNINLLQADCQEVLLGNCDINQLDIGLAKHSELLRTKNEANDESMSTAYAMKKVDIRSCKIRRLKAYIDCDNFTVQESTIGMFDLCGGFGSNVIANIKWLHICDYTTINSSEISCQITDFELKESSISFFVAKSKCKIVKTNIINSTIYNAYGFKKENFDKFATHSWWLIGKLAENNLNVSVKNDAYFQAAKLKHKQEKGIKKIGGSIFGLCSGYGYKPFRAVICCVVMILMASVVLTTVNIINSGWVAISNYSNNLISSLAAIVGQSGIGIEAGFPFWIATIEYIGAVVLFAIFVNALYVRYKD